MSTTHIAPVYDLGTRADYLEMGVGAKKKSHSTAGTNRIAPGFHCDAANIDEFIELGNRLAAGNKRRVKAHGMLVNFHPDELDVNNPDDLQRGGDLALEVARRAFPNSPTMVVVHDDADGGHVHAHVVVLNHDLKTGLAPKKNRNHAAIKRLNDELMREEGMRVVDDGYAAAREKWTARRADLPAFEQSVGDRVAEAKAVALQGDLDAFDDTFEAECAARGVDVIRTEHVVDTDARKGRQKGDVEVGIKYRAVDDTDPEKRPRRRRKAASKLSAEFTDAGLQQAVEAERQRRAAEAQRQAEQERQQADVEPVPSAKKGAEEPVTTTAPQPVATTVLRDADPYRVDPAAYFRRLREEAEEAVTADTGPLAPLPADPSALAPLPPTDEQEDEAEDVPLASAPGTQDRSLASAPDRPTEPLRSPAWDADGVPKKLLAQRLRMAAIDDDLYEHRMTGWPVDVGLLKGIGQRDLDHHGAAMRPGSVEMLVWREEMKAAASEAHLDGDEDRKDELRAAVARGEFHHVDVDVAAVRERERKARVRAALVQQLHDEPDVPLPHRDHELGD